MRRQEYFPVLLLPNMLILFYYILPLKDRDAIPQAREKIIFSRSVWIVTKQVRLALG